VASTNASTDSSDAPAHALDGDLTTRFSSDKNQVPGLYFEVDLGSEPTVYGLQMNVPNSPTDYARGYEVQLSTDGSSWATVANCTGTSTPETVTFAAQRARYVKVVLTANGDKWWSIDEFDLYGTYVRRFLDGGPASSYPAPIVDHAQERQDALARFEVARRVAAGPGVNW
jgi:hypothetical protein